MKLATLKDGSRDGQLIVVSRDLKTAHMAQAIAPTLQRALDDWSFCAPLLHDLSETLNHGKPRHAFAFDSAQCMAPLPRACNWLDGSSYRSHIELVLGARGVAVPEHLDTDPLMYQGGGDDFLGPCDAAVFVSESDGIDFEAELAVVTDDVLMGAGPQECAAHIQLLMLVNDWSLRERVSPELSKGMGFVQSKPATAFGPCAITPDELGDAWRRTRLHLPMLVQWNQEAVGEANAGDMMLGFADLLAHAAHTRNLRAGSIVGGGTVSNEVAKRGFSCIIEKRAREILAGKPLTDYMRFGDTVRIEMKDAQGQSLFGAIEQTVQALAR